MSLSISSLPAFPELPRPVPEPTTGAAASFWRRWRWRLAGLASLLAVGIALTTTAFSSAPEPEKKVDVMLTRLRSVPAYRIDRPPTRRAAEAGLADSDQVLGVSVGGRHRAYALSALRGAPDRHIVNDHVGGRPLSITACPMSSRVRVFIGPPGDDLLPVAFGGYVKRRLIIRAGEGFYYHDLLEPATEEGTPFPLTEHPYERTTWKQWRTAHPETDVYVGMRAR